jgi:hypothetical protein
MAKKKIELKLRTGKLAVKKDPRTLKLADVLDVPAVSFPDSFDVDTEFPEIAANPIPMFLNNQFGCCVMSGRAHQTLRFEFVEQGKLLDITDNEIQRQYFNETGGADSGLVVLDSLKSWRNDGWRAGGRKYQIHLFAQINQHDEAEVKASIFMKVGIGLGIRLPSNYEEVFHSGREWDGSLKGRNENRHYVLATGYTPDGLTFITWAARRFMTWQYVERNCDEAYAVVDDLDNFDTDDSALDVATARDFLDDLDNS